ncbi:MAG TPA: T9SS type A sorting domain-containing protein [Saprospiraceae bacterium]|nr:T9SS type A sorting domain-containing protein [Saprospiraceae bacterium]
MQFKIITLFLFLGLVQFSFAQHAQFRFCGKTSTVSPTNDPSTGQDQRKRGGIRLDFIKVGQVGQSTCCPFHVLGDLSTGKPWTWANATFADGCSANNSPGPCTPCTTCRNPYYGNSIPSGSLDGQIYGNVKIEGLNNDLWIESTGDNNQVCYTTERIDVSPYRGKQIEVTCQFEGYADAQFSIKNVSFSYRYNADPFPTTPFFWNKNSNHVGLMTITSSLRVAVPAVGVNDLSESARFEVVPNPVKNLLSISMDVVKSFDGQIVITNELGKKVYQSGYHFYEGESVQEINIEDFSAGFYIVHFSDQSGRVSYIKFAKI